MIFGGSLLLLAIRRLKQFKLKERFTLLFMLLGLPFMVLAVWPNGVEYLARISGIEQKTVMLLCVSIFLILIIFELLTIVSVMEQKITTLAQMVGILMEHQRLVDRHLDGASPKRVETRKPEHPNSATPRWRSGDSAGSSSSDQAH
ncbi:MAG TPA: DUF2304 domain-containing protein [Tepidisphaeraceae bacterium]|nr:DUF2304 domain-containing protein [Tepidisphaeraceae bacterium]